MHIIPVVYHSSRIPIKDAKDLYLIKESKHQTFRFDHAWDILKYHEKWNEPIPESSHMNDLNSPLKVILSIPKTDKVEVVHQHKLRSSSEERPTGRNAAKTRRRIANEKDSMWQEMMNSFAMSQELMEKQCVDILAINQSQEARANILVELEQCKLEHKQKKLASKQQQLAINQQEMEMRAAGKDIEIMNKNLNNLTPFSKKFWTQKKRAIIRNAGMPRAARNLDFSAGGTVVVEKAMKTCMSLVSIPGEVIIKEMKNFLI
ncbi:hypothetical protein Acr_24g0006870 [Actinidia rufa]|uniref:No apical meristem-associated C-terminal domain-containing protein n=1 Tax=Actinidia rufa TaxID=165716 RepID=A0A7J0GUI1_9ERIC|nr:hypothetical protein Acr_24g0006870 [Actinidia rufa]